MNLQFFPFSINGLKPPLIGEVMVTMVDLWFPIAARLKAVWHQMVPLGPKSVELNAHQPPPCLSFEDFYFQCIICSAVVKDVSKIKIQGSIC